MFVFQYTFRFKMKWNKLVHSIHHFRSLYIKYDNNKTGLIAEWKCSDQTGQTVKKLSLSLSIIQRKLNPRLHLVFFHHAKFYFDDNLLYIAQILEETISTPICSGFAIEADRCRNVTRYIRYIRFNTCTIRSSRRPTFPVVKFILLTYVREYCHITRIFLGLNRVNNCRWCTVRIVIDYRMR